MQTQTTLLDYKTEYTYDWEFLIQNADHGFVAVDTETNGEDMFASPTARVNGFSLSVMIDGEEFADYFPVGHIIKENLPVEYWTKLLRLVAQKTPIYHNSIFDLQSMKVLARQADRDESAFLPEGLFFDTMKLAHMHDENYGKTEDGYSLDGCCKRYLGYYGKKKSMEFEAMLFLVGWNGLSYGNIKEYAREDALITLRLLFAILKALRDEPKVSEAWKKIEAPNLLVLNSMRQLGVRVNLDTARHMEQTGMAIMSQIEKDLGRKLSGTGSRKSMEDLFWGELNLPKILNPKTGKPTLDKDAMERYEIILERQNNPVAQKILEFRGWQKSVTAFYRPYQELVDSDGRIRTNFKPHGTVTGRFSSSKPNLQQIPKESKKAWNGRVKECFEAADGYELWEFDYSQLEFRLSASYSREPKLLDVFNDDSRDIFNEMSADLGLPRQDCKTLTYSIQYGAGAQRIMDVFGYSQTEARNLINSWYDNYPGIRRVSDQAKSMASRTGKVELWSGRYRHFKFPKSEARKAFNSAIQGGAADLVKMTMNNIAREMPELRMVLQVHDALWFEIPKGEVNHYVPQIKHVMEHPVDIDRVRYKVEGGRVGAK